MQDTIKKPTGYFSLDLIEDGKVVYHYEGPNQIMNTVATAFAEKAFGQDYKSES